MCKYRRSRLNAFESKSKGGAAALVVKRKLAESGFLTLDWFYSTRHVVYLI